MLLLMLLITCGGAENPQDLPPRRQAKGRRISDVRSAPRAGRLAESDFLYATSQSV
jgi:hypothetical protein